MKPRREERRWEAGHTYHWCGAGLCGQKGLQVAAVGAKVKRLQPRGVCLLGVPQAGNRVWERPWKSVERTSWKRQSLLLFMAVRGNSETVPHLDDFRYTIYTRDTAGLKHRTQTRQGSVTWAPQRNYLGL